MIPSVLSSHLILWKTVWGAFCTSLCQLVLSLCRLASWLDSSFHMKLFKSSLICEGNCSGCCNWSRPEEKHPSEWHENTCGTLWILVNLCQTLQHYYHSVCVSVCVCVCVCVCCCQSPWEQSSFWMTENKCLVNAEMWLMADPSNPGPPLSHVWCLHIVLIQYEVTRQCLSLQCMRFYMWAYLYLFPRISLPRCGCVEKATVKNVKQAGA